MPKDFKNAMNKQRAANPIPAGQGKLGLVGDVSNPIREELEQATEDLPIKEIAIKRLHDNPFQHLARPNINEEALEELASSIRQNGFYGALLARRKKNTNDQYEIAYGHRRREAALRAGLDMLPVKVIELDDSQMARIMASENFSREDLTPIGQANVVGYLYNMQNMSIEEVAEVIGKKRGWVQPRLALYNAPQDIKDMVEQKPEAMSHVRHLIKIDNAGQRAPLIEQILQNNLTFEQLGDYIEQIDKNFTSYSNAANSESSHNVSRENKRVTQEEIIVRDRLRRAKALQRLNEVAAKFERLASFEDYQLSRQEKEELNDIVERLSAFLD